MNIFHKNNIFQENKMTQYNSANIQLSNSQLQILKISKENGTEVILRLSINMNKYLEYFNQVNIFVNFLDHSSKLVYH